VRIDGEIVLQDLFTDNLLENDNQPAETPSSHRQRLTTGASPRTLLNLQSNPVASVPTPQNRTTPTRQPLAGLSVNNSHGSGFAGYGLTAGMKVSNPAGAVANGFTRPVIRSRGWSLLSFPLLPVLIPHSSSTIRT